MSRQVFPFQQGIIPSPPFTTGSVSIALGDLWSDTSAGTPILKICTSLNPVVFTAVSSGSGASVLDTFITTTVNADLPNETVIGSFLSSVLTIAMPFARGGTLLTPTGASDTIVWQAPFACTVTNVRGYALGATGTVVNALHNTLTLLTSDLTLGSTGSWLDGGAVQNTAFSVNDSLLIRVVSVGGSPTQIAIQVDFTRP